MKIIQYQDSYQQQVMDLILTIQQQEFGIEITREDQPDLETIQTSYIEGGGNFWIAVNEKDEVVGTIALIRLADQNGVVRKMFVKPAYRGKAKVGQHLLDNLVEFCNETGISNLYLGTISKFKAALGFYRKNGFEASTLADFPKDFPVIAVDNVFLAKKLN